MHLRDPLLLCVAPDKDENGERIIYNPAKLHVVLSADATDAQLEQAHHDLNDRWLQQPFDPEKGNKRNMVMRAQLHAALFNIQYARLYPQGHYQGHYQPALPVPVAVPAELKTVPGAKILRFPCPVEERVAALVCTQDMAFNVDTLSAVDKHDEKYAALSFFNGNSFTIFRSTYKKAEETLSLMFNNRVVQRTKTVMQNAYHNITTRLENDH